VQSYQSNWWLLSPLCRTVIQLELATMQSSHSLIAITTPLGRHRLITQLRGCATKCSFLCTAAGRRWINQRIFMRIQEAYIIISYCDSQVKPCGGSISQYEISLKFDQKFCLEKLIIYRCKHSMSCLEMSEDPDYFQVFYVSKYF
jgi:hypothetical protein